MGDNGWFTLRDTTGVLHLCWQECADGVPYVGGQLLSIAEIHEEEHAPKLVAAPDMYEALEAQEAYDNHCMECGPCQEGWHCVAGADLSTKAQNLRATALRKARGED